MAAPMGLFRIFVDECESLQALLEELKHRLTGEALTRICQPPAGWHDCGAAKPETRPGNAGAAERA
jgi:hypothetical protein